MGKNRRKTIKELGLPKELYNKSNEFIRDQILWREYTKLVSEKDEKSNKQALKILQIIRDSTEILY